MDRDEIVWVLRAFEAAELGDELLTRLGEVAPHVIGTSEVLTAIDSSTASICFGRSGSARRGVLLCG